MGLESGAPEGLADGGPTGSSGVLRTFLANIALASVLVAHSAHAGATELSPGELKVRLTDTPLSAVLLSWHGPILAPMADQIWEAFESRKGQTTRFLLRIASPGGSVAEGERVIEVLRRLKASHELDTIVKQGDVCASMCVFIYVQGQKRYGALTSSWLFHEISQVDPVGEHAAQLDRRGWERLVDRYFRPAGVSDAWIADLKPRTVATDYWQTGADLIRSNSGIIHEPLANQTPHVVVPGPRSGERASVRPALPKPGSAADTSRSLARLCPCLALDDAAACWSQPERQFFDVHAITGFAAHPRARQCVGSAIRLRDAHPYRTPFGIGIVDKGARTAEIARAVVQRSPPASAINRQGSKLCIIERFAARSGGAFLRSPTQPQARTAGSLRARSELLSWQLSHKMTQPMVA